MALSGSKTVPFCSRKGANRFYLKWDWTATQSITANTSTVTVKLYIGSYGNGYGINSTASKSGSITIDGTSYSFTNTCGISSGGSKLLATKSKTITHTGDGTKTFAINASFNPNVTISGTTQGNVTMGSTSYTLNTIARASSITSNASWKFPDNKTITISKKNSSFTSTVRVYVGGTLIKGTWGDSILGYKYLYDEILDVKESMDDYLEFVTGIFPIIKQRETCDLEFSFQSFFNYLNRLFKFL